MSEMLTGVKPFGASDISGILYNVVNHDPPPVDKVNPAVPRTVARVVSKLLMKAPHARYPSAADALADLERVRGPAAVAAPPPASNQDDETTPLNTLVAPAEDASLLRRRIPALVFWSVTLLLAAALVAGVLWLRARVAAEQPAGEITIEQLAADQAKRRELAAARAFAAAHNYNEAIRRYNVYLAKYPNNPAALKEREAAQRNLIKPLPTDRTITVSKPLPQPTEQPQQPKPPSRWERVKRFFRGH